MDEDRFRANAQRFLPRRPLLLIAAMPILAFTAYLLVMVFGG